MNFSLWHRAMRSTGSALIFALLLQMTASCAFAHASLIASSPPEAAIRDTAPVELSLHFNESVAPLVFKLASPDGTVRPLDQIAVRPDGLKITLPKSEKNGTYLLSWRVISADGHPVGGSLTYSVGERSSASATTSQSSSPLLLALIWLTRFGLYVVSFIGVGGVLFRAFQPGGVSTSARWITVLLATGLMLLPLSIGAHGLDALSLSWDALPSWRPWQTSLRTAYGTTAGLMLASLIAACIGNQRTASIGKPASIVATLLLGLALAASGHASTAPPTWLARPAVFFHVIAITAWVGSLLPLLLSIRSQQGPAILNRFSRIIPWGLLLLVANGVTLAVLQLGHVSALWLTDYGRIFSVKMVLMLALLAVAAVNRYGLTPRVQLGAPRAQSWMARLIGAEILLVLLIFGAVTTWRFTPPPRAISEKLPSPVYIHIGTSRAMASLTLQSQPGHRLQAEVFVMDGDHVPLKAKEVGLQFSNPLRGIEPLEKNTRPGSDATWQTEPFALPSPGRWHVRIDILISDFESVTLEDDIDIAF